MTRPTRLKVFYGVSVVLLITILLAVYKAFDFSLTTVFVLALALLIPGRINGHYWRDFYTGRRMLDAGWNADAINEFEKFLSRLHKKPALKHLIWFGWGFYTRDVEAMTQNNIGAALIREGDLNQAEKKLAQAISIDAKYPIPYYNMALIWEMRGEREAAAEALNTAQSLGFRRTKIDEIAKMAGSILSTIEGRKKESVR